MAKELGPDKSIIVCLSGRGDKDVVQVKERLEAEGKKKKTKTHKKNIKKNKQYIDTIVFL
ncbi:tryptophan synthase (beta subunit) [Streptococcus infantarius subsp. infantarius]|nr:tryptophan synthase (beta subunit) [Streptococcus infantarius subsp. infantarius]